jgi:hypothetical protein
MLEQTEFLVSISLGLGQLAETHLAEKNMAHFSKSQKAKIYH